MNLRATVVKLSSEPVVCSVRTESDLAIVFQLPAGVRLRLGDQLQIDPGRLDAVQSIKHSGTGESFEVVVRKNDVHDLRLPGAHGSSRLPDPPRP